MAWGITAGMSAKWFDDHLDEHLPAVTMRPIPSLATIGAQRKHADNRADQCSCASRVRKTITPARVERALRGVETPEQLRLLWGRSRIPVECVSELGPSTDAPSADKRTCY
jgi:hypothetical protein